MNRLLRSIPLTLAILLAHIASGRSADDTSTRCKETPYEGHVRAGCPQVISPRARPSNTPNYFGYYVGGGAAFGGEPRCPDEGTWGWDYCGLLPKRIALDWWHGEHAQGGSGAYATERR